jgi:hypothetical protein
VSSRVTELVWQAFNRHADRVRFRAPISDQTVTAEERHPVPPMLRRREEPDSTS